MAIVCFSYCIACTNEIGEHKAAHPSLSPTLCTESSQGEIPADNAFLSAPASSSSDHSSNTTAPQKSLSGPKPISRKDIVAVSILSPRSLSMKLRIRGGGLKVFKPLLKDDRSARYEVAAYLIAKLLGVIGIPPAVMVSLPLSLLQGRLAKDDQAVAMRLAEQALLDDRHWISGAQIDWVPDIDPSGLKKHGGLKALKQWLRPARPKEKYEPMLASSLSNTVVFDYLIGNWDRFSGGNLFINIGADRFVLLDHNSSFSQWGDIRKERMKTRLTNTERFSKSFIDRIRRLERTEIERALAKESTHLDEPLLSKKQILQILKRRDELIAHVESLIKQKGNQNVVVFK